MDKKGVVLKPINTKRVNPIVVDEPLSPAARVFHAPQTNCSIIVEMGWKTKIDVEVFKEGVGNTLLKHPRFSSKLVFDPKTGEPVGWARTTVNLDNHVILADLDPNIDAPDQFVEDYVSNIADIPMDYSKPLWDIRILHIETSMATSVAILRVHHSIGDGISLISLLLACTRKSSDPDALPSLPVDKKSKIKVNASNWFLIGLFSLVLTFKVFWNTLVDLVLFMATGLWLKDTTSPLKGAPGTELAPKRFVHRTFSLDDVKLVKNDMSMTINDVISGITQAGLSRYLNRKYGMAEGEEKLQKINLPKHLRVRSSLFVNLRPATTLEGLAEMMEGDSEKQWQWGNSFGYILIPFHIALRDDPLDYLRDAKATIDKKKRSLGAPFTYAIAKLILSALGLKVIVALTYRILSNTTMSFSNVVGPVDEITFYGHRLAYLAPSVYGNPQALTIHFQSYMDKMTLVLAVDKNVIPDPHRLCDDIVESLRLVKNAVIEKKLTKSQKTNSTDNKCKDS